MERDNVLIIEDKKEDLMFLQQLLQKEGYKVWSCSNGPGGIKLARTTPFSAVLTELRMADMNGVEITKELLSINPMTGVVVMTVFSFVSSAVEAMEKGAYGYISKPFNSAEVSIVVARAIERSRLLGTSQSKDHYVELSAKDGLTGVYNRRFLDTFLTKKIVDARELKDEFAVLMIDLDHFKEYNDTKGHAAGDELLKSVAKVFQEALRQADFVFRYGGEEFTIYLERANKRYAALIAERIRTSVNLYLPVTISMGVSTFPDDGDEMDVLIKKADTALYHAKENGRDQVSLA
ncbi:MAG: diguanylate cyclase [Candidatus Omnitrophica bacterium]|nr:diguanylate cyclase [Candidatus Omnitrophota bacterium]